MIEDTIDTGDDLLIINNNRLQVGIHTMHKGIEDAIDPGDDLLTINNSR